MRVDEIKGKSPLEEWLQGRSQSDASAIAQRAVLRILPVLPGSLLDSRTPRIDIFLLRGLLTIGVDHLSPGADIGRAAKEAFNIPRDVVQELRDFPWLKYNRILDAAAFAVETVSVARTYDAALSAGEAAMFAEYAVIEVPLSGAGPYLWEQIRDDARMFEAGDDPLSAPLWSIPLPDWFRQFDKEMRGAWNARGPVDWDFWLRWWDGVLSGQQLDWALQEAVALIPSEVWEAGPSAVAAAIREIEKGFQTQPPPLSIDGALSRMAPAQPEALDAFSTAVWSHRQDLPPTLEAVLGFCQLEIARLQGKNYRDDEEREECQRQIRVLMTLHQAVSQLVGSLNLDHPMSRAEAERPEKLTRLFRKSLTEWPRENVDDLVDSTCRAALVGLTAMALPMLGASVTIATGVGVVLFGGKKVADAVKAAKDISGL